MRRQPAPEPEQVPAPGKKQRAPRVRTDDGSLLYTEIDWNRGPGQPRTEGSPMLCAAADASAGRLFSDLMSEPLRRIFKARHLDCLVFRLRARRTAEWEKELVAEMGNVLQHLLIRIANAEDESGGACGVRRALIAASCCLARDEASARILIAKLDGLVDTDGYAFLPADRSVPEESPQVHDVTPSEKVRLSDWRSAMSARFEEFRVELERGLKAEALAKAKETPPEELGLWVMEAVNSFGMQWCDNQGRACRIAHSAGGEQWELIGLDDSGKLAQAPELETLLGSMTLRPATARAVTRANGHGTEGVESFQEQSPSMEAARDPQVAHAAFERITRAFFDHAEKARKELAPLLQEVLVDHPPKTFERKQRVVKMINKLLDATDQAIAHPDIGGPCTLLATKGKGQEAGVFSIRPLGTNEEGSRKSAVKLEGGVRLIPHLRERGRGKGRD